MRAVKKGLRTFQIFYSFGASVLGIFMLADTRFSQHPMQVLLWELFTGFAFYCTIGCFHDTAHLTLLPSRRFNVWFGRFYGVLILLPFTAYRQTHILHHVYLMRPVDWECWPYCDPKVSLRFRRVFVWFDLFLGSLIGPFIYSRVFHHKDSPMPERLRRAVRWEYAMIAVSWAALLAFVARHGAWAELAKIWVAPHLMAGMLQSGNKFLEHMGLGSYDPYYATRTVLPTGWVSNVGSHLTFQSSHLGLHHRYPKYPSILLAARARKRDFPYFTSHAAAAWDTLKACVRNPAMGMNAGAPPPARPKIEGAQDYVLDVTRNVLAPSDVMPALPARRR